MKIILKQDIEKLGRSGEIKIVKTGYARNYLIPRNMAELATPGAIKAWQNSAERRAKYVAAKNAKLQELAKRISETTLSFARKVSEEGVMFGSVAKSDIVKKFAEKDIKITKDNVRLDESIKAVGNYEVEIALRFDVKTTVKIAVSALSQQA